MRSPAQPPRWPVLSLPRSLRAYVLGAPLVALLAIMGGLVTTPLRAADGLTFATLVAGGAVAVELRRRLGEPVGVKLHDLLSAWWLPVMVLLPPVYALLAPIPLLALSQWRIRAVTVHRRVFSAAVIGLAYAGPSLVFHGVAGDAGQLLAHRPRLWLLLFLACGLLATGLNALLVSIALKCSDAQNTWRDLLWDPERMWLDVVELSAGLAVTLAAEAAGPFVFAVLPLVVMLQRSFMHTQLSAAARLDGKTGLLNAVTWERETEAELSRLPRTRQLAAVMLIDIDHFKSVNDTYGHETGNRVILAVAQALTGGLRQGDVLGRFGGDEFAVLLPNTDEAEAERAAERLRRRVADVTVAARDGGLVTVTVSVGAAVTYPLGLSVADLLAAADAGLYAAKAAGRDRVRLTAGPPAPSIRHQRQVP